MYHKNGFIKLEPSEVLLSGFPEEFPTSEIEERARFLDRLAVTTEETAKESLKSSDLEDRDNGYELLNRSENLKRMSAYLLRWADIPNYSEKGISSLEDFLKNE
jgi:hypothetical protein